MSQQPGGGPLGGFNSGGPILTPPNNQLTNPLSQYENVALDSSKLKVESLIYVSLDNTSKVLGAQQAIS